MAAPAEAPAAPAAAAASARSPPVTDVLSLPVTLGADRLLYVGLRENARGPFLSLSGAPPPGGRANLVVPAFILADFHVALAAIARGAAALPDAAAAPPANGAAADAAPDAAADAAAAAKPAPPLLSEKITASGPRSLRLFVDVLEAAEGRVCRVSTVERHGRRSSVALPVASLPAVVDAVAQVAARVEADGGAAARGRGAGAGATRRSPGAGQVREVALDGERKVLLEVGSNHRGSFVRITTRGGARSGVMLPFSALGEVADALQQIRDGGDPAAAGKAAAAGAAANGLAAAAGAEALAE